jgi:hypothetical protein
MCCIIPLAIPLACWYVLYLLYLWLCPWPIGMCRIIPLTNGMCCIIPIGIFYPCLYPWPIGLCRIIPLTIMVWAVLYLLVRYILYFTPAYAPDLLVCGVLYPWLMVCAVLYLLVYSVFYPCRCPWPIGMRCILPIGIFCILPLPMPLTYWYVVYTFLWISLNKRISIPGVISAWYRPIISWIWRVWGRVCACMLGI